MLLTTLLFIGLGPYPAFLPEPGVAGPA